MNTRSLTVTELCKAYLNKIDAYTFSSYGISISMRDGNTYSIQDRSIDNFADVTLADLSEMSRHKDFVATLLLLHFFEHVDKLPKNKKVERINLFFGTLTYENIKSLAGPTFMSAFTGKDLLKYYSAYKLTILQEYVREQVETLIQPLPEILLQEVDFSSAMALADYKKMNHETTNNYDIAIEGYWAKAINVIDHKQYSPTMHAELREKILANIDTAKHFYPIPHPKSWSGKEEMVQCLTALEKLAETEDSLQKKKDIILHSVSSEIRKVISESIDQLLKSNIMKLSYCGPADPRLPLQIIDKSGVNNRYDCILRKGIRTLLAGDSEYCATLSDGTKFGWTQALNGTLKIIILFHRKNF